MNVVEHLVVLPILLPLAAGAAMLLVDERRLALKAVVGLVATLALVVTAAALTLRVDAAGVQVYRLGDWPVPFGIALVADRLSAVMVLLASVVGLAALTFSIARWDREGPRFHSLVQFLLMGVNGAFLTGDLFNLFVFFEVLLVASYGLALHGSGPARVVSGFHYIAINLAASLLFLVGTSLLYAATGTLNFADMALRLTTLDANARALVEAGAAIVGLAFLVKAGMWPLCFWLPSTYAAAAAPAAAMFAILTKVGVYALLRTSLLLFGDDAGDSAGLGRTMLVVGGLVTLAFGTLGVLASQELSRLASYSLLVSAGTLLAAVGLGGIALTSAALYYLVVSTLGVAALFLLIELVDRGRSPGADLLAVTAEAFGEAADAEDDEEEAGTAIPATMALLGLAFVGCAVMVAGLPPLAGFLGKLLLLDALMSAPVSPAGWAMIALLLVSGMAAIIGFGRAGIQRFWAMPGQRVPRVRLIEMLPVLALLALCAVLTVAVAVPAEYLDATARELHAPRDLVDAVLPP